METIMSTSSFFEEKCQYINGVGYCTTIIGSQHGGPQRDTGTTAAPSPTTPRPLSTTSTPASPTSSSTPEPVSPSSTRPLPSSTPLAASSTAAAPSNPSGADSSLATATNGTPSLPVTRSQGATSMTSTFTSVLDSTTAMPFTGTSNTSPLATDSRTATPSNPSASGSSSVPLLPSSASSAHRLPVGEITAIAISVGGMLLVLILGLLGYLARRRRQSPIVVISSTSLGSDATVNLSETALTSAIEHTLLELDYESENGKLEYNPRSSFTGSDRSDSMIVQASDFGPLSRSHNRSPLSRFLETVPFLTTPPVSAKRGRGTMTNPGTTTSTDTAVNPPIRTQRTDPTETPREPAAGTEMPVETESGRGRRWERWEGDGSRDGEDGGRRAGFRPVFRYETDAGVCLAGGPPDVLPGTGRCVDVNDDQHTIVTGITLPPPYSRY